MLRLVLRLRPQLAGVVLRVLPHLRRVVLGRELSIDEIRSIAAVSEIDAMLGKIAHFYEEEVDQAVENMTSLIEPKEMIMKQWMKPEITESEAGMEVTSYLPAELDRA